MRTALIPKVREGRRSCVDGPFTGSSVWHLTVRHPVGSLQRYRDGSVEVLVLHAIKLLLGSELGFVVHRLSRKIVDSLFTSG
jgi:hypothetical protein